MTRGKAEFLEKIIVTADCWLWNMSTFGFGYGQLNIAKKHVSAHRRAWELWNGAIPEGMCVLHRCDVPACCNPAHLFLGTRTDNQKDMAAKGRAASGERNSQSTLKADQVLAIYADPRPQPEIARQYGVRQSAVSRIKTGNRWASVTNHKRKSA